MANPHHYSNKIKIIGLQQNSQGFPGFPEVFANSLSFADFAGLSETCPKFTPHVIMSPWGLKNEGEFLTPRPAPPPIPPVTNTERTLSLGTVFIVVAFHRVKSVNKCKQLCWPFQFVIGVSKFCCSD